MEPPVNTKIKNLQKDEETTSLSPRGELLRWHIRLGHLSFSKMINLMELGILPHKLLKIRPPMCACCKIGAMTKQRRRVKGGKYKNMRKANAPGECVSMDQIESRTLGFIGVLRGFITKKRYTCATILWTTIVDSLTLNSKPPPIWTKLSRPKQHLKHTLVPYELKYDIIMPTTADSLTRTSRQRLKTQDKLLVTVESTPIFKMGEPKRG